jgi:hypothetical protein
LKVSGGARRTEHRQAALRSAHMVWMVLQRFSEEASR